MMVHCNARDEFVIASSRDEERNEKCFRLRVSSLTFGDSVARVVMFARRCVNNLFSPTSFGECNHDEARSSSPRPEGLRHRE
jgi:hypothetical protein